MQVNQCEKKMWTFLVFLIITVNGVLSSFEHNLPKSILPMVKFEKGIQQIYDLGQFRHRRFRRQIGERSKLSCVSNCMKLMMKDITDMGIDSESNGVLLNKDLLAGDIFEQYCDISQEGKDCLDSCHLSQTYRRGIDMAFSAANYICIDHYDEFRQHLSCYKRADTEIQEECFPRCGDPMEVMRQSRDALNAAMKAFSLQRIKKLLDTQCKYLRCNIRCQSPILQRQCESEDAAHLLSNMATVTLRQAQNMLDSIPFGTTFWPKSCRAIADFGFPTLTNRAAIPKATEYDFDNEDGIDNDLVENEDDDLLFVL